MPRSKPYLTINPPLGGVVKRTGFQNAPPFSLYSATNLRPWDCDTGRAVLATRPDFRSPPGPGAPVNMLIRINGRRSGFDFQSMISAVSGQVYWWDGVTWRASTGSGAALVDTGRTVFGTPFLQQAFICIEDSKPLVFDYPTGTTVVLTEFAGTCPSDCRMATVWQGALWLAGQLANPHVLYGSRTGGSGPFDWDFSADVEDAGRPFGGTGSDEGLLNGPITALFGHTAATMVVSTVEGIMKVEGHPNRGGTFHDISGPAYILGQGAWAKTPGNTVYMLTQLGLMKLDAAPNSVATPISRDLIPDDLVGLTYDYENPTITLCYDPRFDCIYIHDRNGSNTQSWVYDISSGRFWEDSYSTTFYTMLDFKPFATSDRSSVLFGRVT